MEASRTEDERDAVQFPRRTQYSEQGSQRRRCCEQPVGLVHLQAFLDEFNRKICRPIH